MTRVVIWAVAGEFTIQRRTYHLVADCIYRVHVGKNMAGLTLEQAYPKETESFMKVMVAHAADVKCKHAYNHGIPNSLLIMLQRRSLDSSKRTPTNLIAKYVKT